MSKYKTIMARKGIQQKEILDNVHRVDERVDKSLLSKIVNDVCLPTPEQFAIICDTLSCTPAEIYDPREATLLPPAAEPANVEINPNTAYTRKRRQNSDFYNLTVEIPRNLAERVFSPATLGKLGFRTVTAFMRHVIAEIDSRVNG